MQELQKTELEAREAKARVSHGFEVGDFVLVRKHSGNARGMNKIGDRTNKFRGP